MHPLHAGAGGTGRRAGRTARFRRSNSTPWRVLRRRTSIPLLIDEAAFTKEEVARRLQMGCGSVYSLKLVKSGGLFEMKRAAGVAAAHGLELYGGCLLESSIGAAAHLAAFSTLPKLEWGTEHFGPRIVVEDLVTEPLRFEEFEICVPEGPGLGVQLGRRQDRSFARKD